MSYPDYNGFQRSDTPKQDWSGFSRLTMHLKADGSDIVRVVMTAALLLLGGCAVSIAHKRKANPER